MISNSDGVDPLLALKKKLEEQIQVHLDMVAILRKRHEVISQAIDVMRSSDSELLELPKVGPKPPVKKMDFEKVEAFILKELGSGSKSKGELEHAIFSEGHFYTDSGLYRILSTCPDIARIGERNAARYQLTREK